MLDPNGITITELDVNTGTTALGTPGTVEIYRTTTSHVGKELDAALWSFVASGPTVAAGNNLPSNVVLGNGVCLPFGSHGIAVRHVGLSMRYTNGDGTNQTGATAELAFQGGTVTAGAFTGSFFSPRVFNGNIYYTAGSGQCAGALRVGAGCYDGATSFYELFPGLTSFDFVGSAGNEQVIRATAIGAQGYVVTAGSPAWFQPTGPKVLNNATTPVAMADNSYSQPITLPFVFPYPGGSTNVIHASANGYVRLAATTSNVSDSTPTVEELLGSTAAAQPPRLCPLWCDLQPATNVPTNPQSGVYYDVDPSGQTVYVTWLDVADRRGVVPAAGTTSVTCQCALHSDGSFEFRYRSIVPGTGNGAVIVGWSRSNSGGSASPDPGNRDLSASIPFATNGPDRFALTHTTGLPILGTAMPLSVTRVPAVSPLALLFFGDVTLPPPGINLGFAGAPGCSAYSNGSLASAAFPAVAGTAAASLPIPNNPLLVGVVLSTQAVALSLDNALNLVTSNGNELTLGN